MRRLNQRGAIAVTDASDPAIGCTAHRDAVLARFHVCKAGAMLFDAAAPVAMWCIVPLLRLIGMVPRNRAVLATSGRAYRRFLRERPSLQVLAHKSERVS